MRHPDCLLIPSLSQLRRSSLWVFDQTRIRSAPIPDGGHFSSEDMGVTIRCLLGDNVSTFINVVDEVRSTFAHREFEISIDAFYRPDLGYARAFTTDPKEVPQIVAQDVWSPHAFPRALKISTCYDRTGTALCWGGYADMCNGGHCGREVAVKVIRTYSNDNLRMIIGVNY